MMPAATGSRPFVVEVVGDVEHETDREQRAPSDRVDHEGDRRDLDRDPQRGAMRERPSPSPSTRASRRRPRRAAPTAARRRSRPTGGPRRRARRPGSARAASRMRTTRAKAPPAASPCLLCSPPCIRVRRHASLLRGLARYRHRSRSLTLTPRVRTGSTRVGGPLDGGVVNGPTLGSALVFPAVSERSMTSNSEPGSPGPAPGSRGVGAAAPRCGCTAADIGAAWGRSGRGQVAACAPDEDTLTLAWDAATAALDRRRRRGRRGRRDLLGHQPPAVRRRPEPGVPRRRARPARHGRRRAARGLRPRGHGGADRRRRRDRGGLGPHRARGRRPTRCGPGSAPASRRAAARERPRSCCGRQAVGRRSAPRVTQLAAARRPVPRRRRDRQPRPLRRAAVPRRDLPAERRGGHQRRSRRHRFARGRSPTPTAASARWSRRRSAPTPAASAIGLHSGRRHRRGRRAARRARRDRHARARSPSSAPAAAARPACS